uniref:Ig-like domain-containing protein n=1 Tax=Prolemur simus TaxID=1328070 RepID=A0A8C8ZZG7_PROSS
CLNLPLRSCLPYLCDPSTQLTTWSGQPFISLTGPSQRTTPGDSVLFNCTAGPFGSQDFNVTWLKNSCELPASAQHPVTDKKGNYSITSKAWVTLAQQDVLSKITCNVTHRTLKHPLQATMNLSQVLRVIPTLKITSQASGTYVRVQERVNLTCHASHFYPASHLHLTWMENGHTIQTVKSPRVTGNPDGTYSLEHTRQAEATLEGSAFACWIVQDEQPPVKANITLRAQPPRHGQGRRAHSYNLQGPLQRSEPGTSIRLTYTTSGFSTRHVTVTWLKNKHKLPKPQTSVRHSGHTYNVTSSVLVPLKNEDIFSYVVCHVEQNSTLFFQKTISLDQYLRVPPTVTVSQSSTSSGLVLATCHVQRFYPQSVQLTWQEDCHMLKGTEQPASKKNNDGSYTLEGLLLVNASVQGSERVLTCMVQHETQPPIRANLILSTAAHTIYKFTGSPGPEMPVLIFVAFLLGLKVLLVISNL